MRVLFIHGRAQGGKDKAVLQKEWEQALTRGFAAIGRQIPADTTFDFPFYGDLLDKFAIGSEASFPADVTAKGPTDVAAEYRQFLQAAVDEVRRSPEIAIPDEAIRARMRERNVAEVTAKGPANWEWVQATLALLDELFPGATDAALSVFLRDVFLYTQKPQVRSAINAVVKSKLTSAPTVVVSHSLGTVVAYNVLQETANRTTPLFVTLGSPLGIKAIKVTLGPLKNPAGVKGWYNGYDERDVVALKPLDQNFFKVSPRIRNDNGLQNSSDNHHGIVSYLDKKAVAAEIAAALG